MGTELKMKKILLVSLWDNENFGNRLQMIALKRIIEKMGYSVECVPNDYSFNYMKIKGAIKYTLGKMGVRKYKVVCLKSLRKHSLRKSCDKLIQNQSKLVYNFNIPSDFDETEYAAAIVGSDQVWHKWTPLDNELYYYYLQFMPAYKRISYAASFGFDSFPNSDREIHAKYLKEMRAISCREKTGCQLVKDLVNIDAELVLDPTLCVGRDYWSSIEERPFFTLPKRYVVVMLLGKKDEHYATIQQFAMKNKLKIIDIMDEKNYDIWKLTIGSFIWLIHNAEFVFTDSFHCTVFSILYERTFTVFQRRGDGFEKMFDRISTLLELCGLSQCVYHEDGISNVPLDFSGVNDSLSLMVTKSLTWLHKTLCDS